MPKPRSAEIRLLLLACTGDDSPERRARVGAFLADTPVDWQRLEALAERHRLVPWLYLALRDQPGVPGALLERLRAAARHTATDNLLKLHEHRTVAALFAQHGIAHLPMKGVYLAEHAYPSPGLRGIGDLDLLVAKTDVLRAAALLETLGYRPSRNQTHYRQAGEAHLLDDLFEIALGRAVANGSHFVIDLHWEVICLKKEFAAFRLEDLTADPARAAEWSVLLLVAHHGVTDTWRQLFHVNDLFFLLKNKPLDWPWLLAQTRRLGIEPILLAGLHWCQQLGDLPLPPDVARAVAAPRVRALAAAYERGWEAERAVPLTRMALLQVYFFAKSQPRFDQKLRSYARFFGQRVFYYGFLSFGKTRFYVPKGLGFVTLPSRVLRYVRRYVLAPR